MTKGTYADLKKRLQEVPGASAYDVWFKDVCKRVESYGVSETDSNEIVLRVLASGDVEELETIKVTTTAGYVDLDVKDVFSKEGYDV